MKSKSAHKIGRRDFMKHAGAGLGVAVLAAQAQGQAAPPVQKTIGPSFPSVLENIKNNGIAAGQRWRSMFGPDEVVQRVRPTESTDYLPNPHRGTATFQHFNGDPLYGRATMGFGGAENDAPTTFKRFDGNLSNGKYPDTTLAYLRYLWSVLEPAKGAYRWDILDSAFEAGRARGQTVQLRVQPYSGDGKTVPNWFWDAGGKLDPKSDPQRRNPDHNDPTYIKHFGEFISAFGRRFDGHPDLESVDVVYGGYFGEEGGNSSDETAEKLVNLYIETFKKTQLISMIGPHGCTYASKFKHIGWRADCFGDLRASGRGVVPDGLNWNSMYDLLPLKVFENGLTDTWKTAPVLLESAGTVEMWFRRNLDIDWILEQGLKYHASAFMPKSFAIPDEWRDKIDAFDRRLGYRFVLREVDLPLEAKPGDRIPTYIWIENVGVAPIYRDYRLVFRFRQGKDEHLVPVESDVRQWMPGNTVIVDNVVFPEKLQRGEVAVDLGVMDQKLQEPKVLFAVNSRSSDKWHPLSLMDAV